MATQENGSGADAPPSRSSSSSAAAAAAAGVDKGVDFANYFCTYAYLYHQKEMLCDRVRMDAYYNAVFRNKHHFRNKVVLDVGTGSGILAIWSAQAGARKVYAVEATKMAEHARELAKANGVDDVVEVIEGSMEEVTLPEKVDVIISEWMGYFLLRESMFDSVICARDRWLRPDGAMYPSHARMWVAPIRSGLGDQKIDDFEREMNEWHNFVDETEAHYGVNMNALTKAYRAEHEKYYLKIVGTAAVIKEIDCLTATVDEIRSVMAQVTMPIIMDRARVSAFAGWFDVHFRGSTQNPAMHEIELTTAPSEDFGTHWGQQVFLLHPPIRANEGDKIIMSFTMSRSKENHRLMNVEFTCELEQSSGKRLSPVTSKVFIE
ncbi:protein arginine N-methyltransferase PRMT10 isoform X2 [Ananas comosus]|uniref:Protein arginine N-methyltransferase PRMT10 n=1 Tax=Ananas comosus TaxID=4615 RepID=A0A6P5FZR1_ANACO|nr:protein arginine N-methyltransferase PRMT10 isoform X2 [Ananas comosus]